MDTVQDDRCFMVILRYDGQQGKAEGDGAEQPMAYCSTYGEARRIRQSLQAAAPGDFVIRYVGPAGGGD